MNEITTVERAESMPPSEAWSDAGWLPCELTVEVHVPKFTVRDLLTLQPGSIVNTGWKQSTNVPVIVNARMLGWTELDVVGVKLAARLVEFA